MTHFAEKYLVESSRLKSWNYSDPGIYFITICTIHHNNFFGKIINDQINLSNKGLIVKNELLKTFQIRLNLILHTYVIMPNHIHILMEIKYKNYDCRDVLQNVSTKEENKFSKISPKSTSVSVVIRQFKSSVTRIINPKTCFFAWQPRYYDQIIKDKNEYYAIKNYINNNPRNWQKDKLYHL